MFFRSIKGVEKSDASLNLGHSIRENKIQEMLKQKIKKYYDCGQRDYTPEAAEAVMNILRGMKISCRRISSKVRTNQYIDHFYVL